MQKNNSDQESSKKNKTKEKFYKETLENIATIKLTKRLALVDIDWRETDAKNIMMAIASVLDNPNEFKEINIYKTKFGKEKSADINKLDSKEMKQSYFAVLIFETLDCALDCFNKCETLGLEDINTSMTFKVIPDHKEFLDEPNDTCKIEEIEICKKETKFDINLTNKKIKEKKGRDGAAEDVKDERFKEIYSNEDFLVDEDHASYKKKKKINK
ncbi:hypothetical protein H311_03379 [Anncaliia algerae PRA109]|nr:hypothetical protein H311_03379 [Anncaliia algerae PRA109]